MIVAGLGFRDETTADDIAALLMRALEHASLSLNELSHLATIEAKAEQPSLVAVARQLGKDIVAIGPVDLQRFAPMVQTHSSRVMALHGVGSVAEAAALCAVGKNAKLRLPRIASERVTCALAQGDPE
ncbi:cobalamin biosynthesis protein [Microvirga sp. 2MCAF38]|uniref:cobalamin biosynthesis protein n=1 Tax=Microvirga sp. 2MCAF38 TaxID=3232989 RepID=UPI003F995C95